MRKPDSIHDEMEKALLGLMPVAFREESQVRMDAMIDELSGDSKVTGFDFRKAARWLAAPGLAAAIAAGVFLSIQDKPMREKSVVADAVTSSISVGFSDPELVLLTESDRVEKVSDDGLFIDTGGSAMRKVRIRVVEESRIRDEETGIVVMLTTPREEMYMVPISSF